MGKKGEVVNNTDIDDENSIKSDDENVMENLKNIVSNLSKKDKKDKKDKKKKSKKEEEEIVIDEDDSDEDDSEEDNSQEDDTEEDDTDEDNEDDSDDSDDTDEDEDALFNNNIMALASLFQESFYDSDGVSVGESLSKIANLMEKFYNLEKKKYQHTK